VPGASHDESKAWVKHTRQGDVFVTENASFDFVRVLRDEGASYTWLLVEHTDHNEWSDSRDGISGAIGVKAWTLSRTNLRTLRWAVNSQGNSGIPLPDLGMFQVSNWPCCSTPFENIYFGLLNGKRLYTTNGSPKEGRFGQDSGLVRLDGGYDGTRYSQTRYIGFGAITSQKQKTPSLQYGTDQVIKQRFSLLGREYGDNFDVPKVSVSQDGSQQVNYLQLEGPFSCTIVLKFDDGPEVRIPLENDVVRTDKATLPPGYSLRAEKDQ